MGYGGFNSKGISELYPMALGPTDSTLFNTLAMVGRADPYRGDQHEISTIGKYGLTAALVAAAVSYVLLRRKIKQHKDGKPRKMTPDEKRDKKIIDKVNRPREPY